MTTVLPQIRAWNDFQAGMATGKFQGVISPQTPIGSRNVRHILLGNSLGAVSP